MCGRYTLTKSLDYLGDVFAEAGLQIAPRYNISPSDRVPVLRYAEEDTKQHLALLQWGLIPAWVKDRKSMKIKPQINARADGIESKPFFRAAYKKRHCIVLADGFYEWRLEGKAKQPYYFRLPNHEPFGFAGLWEQSHLKDEDPLETCTIITTDANPYMKQYHSRMPVILQPADWDVWLRLDSSSGPVPDYILHPAANEGLNAIPVSTRVNNPRVDDPSLIQA